MAPKPGQSSAAVALVRAGRRRASASVALRSSAPAPADRSYVAEAKHTSTTAGR